VHPFLFQLDGPDNVRRDWEATRFEWVDRDEVRRRERKPTVPQLYEAFESVWPPWPAEFAIQANLDMALRWLRGDRTMGAGTLARAAAIEVAKLARLCPAKRLDEMRPLLDRAAERLQEVRPAMAAVANMLDDARQSIATADSRDELVQAVESLIDDSRKAEERVAHEAAAIIAPGSRVMTISFSGTVQRALLAVADKLQRVLVCEGRPLMEGRRLAEELQKRGVRVTLLTDAQAFTHMQDADMLLLGADTVLADGSVVNKTGSALLALAARHWKKPIVVAAETLKFVRHKTSSMPSPQESNPPSEVWRDPPPGIDVANLYFDTLPASLVDQLITEHGRVA
jgi:translation initiation factor 2B subunit (eIF-2B alpha/beta/delta family)